MAFLTHYNSVLWLILAARNYQNHLSWMPPLSDSWSAPKFDSCVLTSLKNHTENTPGFHSNCKLSKHYFCESTENRPVVWKAERHSLSKHQSLETPATINAVLNNDSCCIITSSTMKRGWNSRVKNLSALQTVINITLCWKKEQRCGEGSAILFGDYGLHWRTHSSEMSKKITFVAVPCN